MKLVTTLTKFELFIVILILAVLFFIVLPSLDRVRSVPPRILCGTNLSGLGKALVIYANNNDSKYPTVDKWCDLLIEHGEVTEKNFVCDGALRANNKYRSHFAINPNCDINSPPETVLLFETKGGWNRFGGRELLSTDNHHGDGCNILFNDGRVEFILPRKFDKLKWGDEQKQ